MTEQSAADCARRAGGTAADDDEIEARVFVHVNSLVELTSIARL